MKDVLTLVHAACLKKRSACLP